MVTQSKLRGILDKINIVLWVIYIVLWNRIKIHFTIVSIMAFGY